MDTNLIINAVVQDPFGKIGGIFNILIHKQQLNQLTGDGVTKNLPSLTLMEISELARNGGRDLSVMKLASARPVIPRKPYTAIACSRKSQIYTPREATCSKEVKVLITNPLKKTTKLKKKENVPSRIPTSAQPQIYRKDSKMVDYRLITSPTLRRKAYSATIAPKTNRPRSPAEGASRPPSPKIDDKALQTEKEAVNKEITKRKTYEMQIPSKMHFQEINGIRRISSMKSKVKINVEGKTK